MFPVLFSVGPLSFRTINLFLALALFFAAFIFWRKSKEEHYDESVVFDGLVLATIVGLVFSRVGFIALHFDQFGLNAWNWLDLVAHAGFSPMIGVAAAAAYLYRYAMGKKWDVFEIMDFSVLGLCFGIAIGWLGLWFDGSGFGHATSMPWGLVFPGVFEKHHPVQLYFFGLYLLLFWYLSWADYRYRTFNWYRAGRNTAQTGYLTSMFVIFSGIFGLGMAWVRPPQFFTNFMYVDVAIHAAILVFGILLLLDRSGRSVIPSRLRR